MLDLNRFTKEKIVLMPIIKNFGVFGGRRFTTTGLADGWYWIKLGNDAQVERAAANLEDAAYLLDCNLPIIKGYWIGNAIIPYNFADAKFRGFGETIEVLFGDNFLGAPVVCRIWENGLVLYQGVDGSHVDLTLYQVKERFEKGNPITDLKGVTPEMRYFYLLMSLQREHINTWKKLDQMKLSAEERTKRVAEYQNTLSGRLQGLVEAAGAKLVRFNKRGENKIEIVWRLGEQTFNSIMNMNFRMLELGYCAEGHDTDHTISSAINLAKIFQEEDLIHVTRE